ncbi:hypothetical protein [Thalassospira indica]|uniref:Sulfotransferase domain-containing protein n=1 Tax=Thalassospira indica TaxID=1891279 RepID=A0ABM6XXG1_9PROT|nr:hypothetical protein [Thalassospira indica]AXO14387.1 hypothetical protein DY252_09240 [Thalassospira indica]OAZ11332.1 hypothetical protein TH15_17825 [Thalassospira profundimaris]
MKKFILHIGSGKCASSSIQAYFGQNFSVVPEHESSSGPQYRYFCIRPGGEIVSGEDLLLAHQSSPSGYVCSCAIRAFYNNAVQTFKNIRDRLAENEVAVLSFEAWAEEIRSFDLSHVFKEAEIEVEVIFVVRSPIDLLNSAWWQWGVWTGNTIEADTKKRIGMVKFAELAERWGNLPNVSKIHLIELQQNPFKRLQEILELDSAPAPHLNVSTHPALLEHLIKYQQEFGRGEHNSGMEFHLNNILDLPKRKVPFVLDADLRHYILSETLESSTKIAKPMITEDSSLEAVFSEKYLSDRLYQERHVCKDFTNFATSEERDELTTALIRAALGNNLIKLPFSAYRYYRLNPDVQQAGVDPYKHFLLQGIAQGRRY